MGAQQPARSQAGKQGLGQEVAAGGTPRLGRQLVGCLLEGWGRVVLHRSCRSLYLSLYDRGQLIYICISIPNLLLAAFSCM